MTDQKTWTYDGRTFCACPECSRVSCLTTKVGQRWIDKPGNQCATCKPAGANTDLIARNEENERQRLVAAYTERWGFRNAATVSVTRDGRPAYNGDGVAGLIAAKGVNLLPWPDGPEQVKRGGVEMVGSQPAWYGTAARAYHACPICRRPAMGIDGMLKRLCCGCGGPVPLDWREASVVGNRERAELARLRENYDHDSLREQGINVEAAPPKPEPQPEEPPWRSWTTNDGWFAMAHPNRGRRAIVAVPVLGHWFLEPGHTFRYCDAGDYIRAWDNDSLILSADRGRAVGCVPYVIGTVPVDPPKDPPTERSSVETMRNAAKRSPCEGCAGERESCHPDAGTCTGWAEPGMARHPTTETNPPQTAYPNLGNPDTSDRMPQVAYQTSFGRDAADLSAALEVPWPEGAKRTCVMHGELVGPAGHCVACSWRREAVPTSHGELADRMALDDARKHSTSRVGRWVVGSSTETLDRAWDLLVAKGLVSE